MEGRVEERGNLCWLRKSDAEEEEDVDDLASSALVSMMGLSKAKR